MALSDERYILKRSVAIHAKLIKSAFERALEVIGLQKQHFYKTHDFFSYIERERGERSNSLFCLSPSTAPPHNQFFSFKSYQNFGSYIVRSNV